MPVGSSDAERRVLTLQNPSIPSGRGSTQTIQAAVQMIHGGRARPLTPGYDRGDSVHHRRQWRRDDCRW